MDDVHLSINCDGLGEEYGLSGRLVARLLRVNELVAELEKPVSKEIAVKIRILRKVLFS